MLRRSKINYIMPLHIFTNRVGSDIRNVRDVIDFIENNLSREIKHLEKQAKQELDQIENEEEKEFVSGWWAEDFFRLDKVLPDIQRRALFTTIMSMTEADLLLGCRMCQNAFKIPIEFKGKRSKRVVSQAMEYLLDNLTIRRHVLEPYWGYIQILWSIRNAIVHHDGKIKVSDMFDVANFCDSVPTIEINDHRKVILKKGSMEMIIHQVDLFFSRLIAEIKKNDPPYK